MLSCTIKFPPVVGVPNKGTKVHTDRNGYIHPKDVLLREEGVMPKIRF